MYENLIFWVWIIAAFLFGLFLGKNNSSKVQELGEEVAKKATEAKDVVVKDINQSK